MKITGVKIHRYEWERTPFHWRDGIMPGGAKTGGSLLQIDTDEGVSGFSPRAGGDIEEIKFQLIGQDPMNRERIWQAFWKNLRSSDLGDAIGPVDVALWDLFGQVTGQSIHRLLGGNRDRIPAYASTLTLDSIDEYMALAERSLKAGFKAIKLHAWGRLDEDAELCRRLRKLVGPDIALMYDASSAFNQMDDAIWFGRVLEEQNYLWYEEPMDHFNMTALARLARELTIPLATAEATHGGPFDAMAHLSTGAADIILTGPIDRFKGGFTGVMKTSAICEGYASMCAIHGGSIASLHAACAVPGCKYFERLIRPEDHEPAGIQSAAYDIDAEGYAAPWESPGLGLRIDWSWIEKHRSGLQE